MPLLNTANNVYLGSSQVDKVYLGSNLIWPSGVSGAESLFQPGSTPSSIETTDTVAPGNNLTLGMAVDFAVAGTINAIWIYKPNPGWSGTTTAGVYTLTSKTTGTLQRSGSADASGFSTGWNRIALSAPLTVSTGTPYMLAVNMTGIVAPGSSQYAYTSGHLTAQKLSGSGNIRALADGDDTYYTNIRNGRYQYGSGDETATLRFTPNDFGATWYGIDVEFTAS